jgi:rSAM/selenodomain-associated transferase 1
MTKVHGSATYRRATPSQDENVLIVVAKHPTPGRTKTRLTPPLSPRQAADLYECFLKDTLELARGLENVQPAIAYLPAGETPYFARLAPDFDLLLQRGEDLGERLDHTLTYYLERGYQRAAVMNSDSPTLPEDYLTACFETLTSETDIAIGPCADGGYYLLGTRQPVPRLTREVRMSTPHVTADTLALAAEEGLRARLLPGWYDVDDARTLTRLMAELAARPQAAHHTCRFLEQHRFMAEEKI